jgi:hypothetical protein
MTRMDKSIERMHGDVITPEVAMLAFNYGDTPTIFL